MNIESFYLVIQIPFHLLLNAMAQKLENSGQCSFNVWSFNSVFIKMIFAFLRFSRSMYELIYPSFSGIVFKLNALSNTLNEFKSFLICDMWCMSGACVLISFHVHPHPSPLCSFQHWDLLGPIVPETTGVKSANLVLFQATCRSTHHCTLSAW